MNGYEIRGNKQKTVLGEARTLIYEVLPVMPKEMLLDTAAMANTQMQGYVWPTLPPDLYAASAFP
jgi:hypothetical protein